ncbi:MAG: NAD(P)-dependent alcohol dehydrogenase [Myxococcales bacterium]|nr:NAD(P)-dependent alcohol dehydrogenase [Myxococcales bacterium]
MKAVVHDRYGSPDVLRLEDVPAPSPAPDDVLVRVRAASLNSWDWDLLTGTPRAFRLAHGLLRPRHRVLGADVAGHVEAVGDRVTRFAPGDEVFGDLSAHRWGGFAELAVAPEAAWTRKPPSMGFEQAAALPQAGCMAEQGLVDDGGIQPGHAVMINGGGGGVGTFAIQIARAIGAEVTAVDRTDKLDTMRALGADRVLDYTREDFAREASRYDLILDVTAHRSMFAYARALRRGGTYVMLGGAPGRILQLVVVGPWISWRQGKRMRLSIAKPNHGLAALIERFEAGTLTPVIDRVYALDEVPEAFRHFGRGAHGKLVVRVG